ncbi:MAG: universal stress protein [Deltaproteobacteria bacterium]|nr:universal stress protein [Deltaproteobacteria bacterium]
MKTEILVSIKDTLSSAPILDFLHRSPLCREDQRITLLHVWRKPSASEELMGKKFAEEEQARVLSFLQEAKERLIEDGYAPNEIKIDLVTKPYPTIADGIIDQFHKGDYDIVVIGRRTMSKAEEFVLGDVCAKLIRALEGTAVLVVRTA